MKGYDLLKGMGHIDDDLVAEALEAEAAAVPQERKVVRLSRFAGWSAARRWGTAAAAVAVLCLAGLGAFGGMGQSAKDAVPAEAPMLGMSQTTEEKNAALGSGMEIAYYSAEGTRIATLSKSAEETGFPVCMALSENGKQLAVSYVTAVNGAVSTNLIFYSFRNPESADKVIAELSYSGIVIPDIRYISDTVAAVFRDNGVSFFGGSGKPVENASVDFEDEIISTFTGDGFAGFIFRNRNSTNPYRMEIYSGNGKLISRTDMEIVYDRISVCGNEVLLSSSSELAIYTKKGICRFYGGIEEGNLSGIQKIGRKRYLVVTDMNTKVIELN